MDLRDGKYTSPITPDTQVFFDTATPTTAGVVFNPNTPASEDTLYVSSLNGSTWIYQDGAYITYAGSVVSNTEWYITGTTIDAGGNKNIDIERSGKIKAGGVTVGNLYSLPATAPGIGQVLGYGVSGTTEWVSVASEQANTVLFADLATTEVLNACTYYNGIANDGVGATLTGNVNGQLATVSNPTKIDNIVTALNQIILVWNQSNAIQNGLYKVTQLGSISQPFILVRADDADQQSELYPIQVNIFFGQLYANRAFLQKTVDPVVGTSNIVFTGSQIGISTAQVNYVDTATSGALPSCTYASGTNTQIPGINATLTADVNGSLGTINGVALIPNMRILVRNQSNSAHNGDYIVNNAGGVSSKWKLYRISAWGGEFLKLIRDWKVNNSASTKFGSRYSTDLVSLTNLNVGITNLIFNEVYALPSTYILPTTDGTVGQVFKTDGAGNITFVNPSSIVSTQTVTSAATITATSTNDLVNVTALAVGTTIANPTGTFVNGQIVSYRIKDNATPQTIAYGTKFKAFGSALPTTTVASKITLLSAMYNSVADTFETVNSQEK